MHPDHALAQDVRGRLTGYSEPFVCSMLSEEEQGVFQHDTGLMAREMRVIRRITGTGDTIRKVLTPPTRTKIT